MTCSRPRIPLSTEGWGRGVAGVAAETVAVNPPSRAAARNHFARRIRSPVLRPQRQACRGGPRPVVRLAQSRNSRAEFSLTSAPYCPTLTVDGFECRLVQVAPPLRLHFGRRASAVGKSSCLGASCLVARHSRFTGEAVFLLSTGPGHTTPG